MSNKKVYKDTARVLNVLGFGHYDEGARIVATAAHVETTARYLAARLLKEPKSDLMGTRGVTLQPDGYGAYAVSVEIGYIELTLT